MERKCILCDVMFSTNRLIRGILSPIAAQLDKLQPIKLFPCRAWTLSPINWPSRALIVARHRRACQRTDSLLPPCDAHS